MNENGDKKLSQVWRFFLLSMVILIGVMLGWLYYQYDTHQRQAELTANSHFAMIRSSIRNMLQDGRFEHIQPFIDEWARFHPQTLDLRVTSQNGFVHGEFHKPWSTDQAVEFKEIIHYGYRGQAELKFDFDTSDINRQLLVNGLTTLAVLLILAVIGYILANRTIRLLQLSGQLNRRNHQLQQEHALIQSMIDNLPDLIYFKDVEGRYRGYNRVFREFHDLGATTIRGKTDSELFDTALAEDRANKDLDVIKSKQPVQKHVPVRNADGQMMMMDTTLTPYFDDKGVLLGMIGICRDMTRLYEYQAELEKLAYHDPLTGLPNRLYLRERMQQDMSKARRHNRKMAICNIDLDGFKPINDHYGHETGDLVLQTLANRLSGLLRQEDTAARWGGDEFTVLLNDIQPDRQDMMQVLGRIQEAFSTPIEVGNIDVQLSCSIGITLYPDDDQDADTLIRHADQAMYHSKQHGKNQYTFFDSDQDRSMHQIMQKISQLMGAIANNELRLYYQPQINLKDGSLHGVEALVRWQHPRKGLLPPAAFLPSLENHEANVTLDMWVMETAIRQLSEWQEAQQDFQVSVNLTATTLEDSGFLTRLEHFLQEYPATRNKLQLEIVETTSLYNLEQVSKTIQDCMDLGASIALDDFGTGYSSLTYLRRIPATTLKIDRSFVIDMIEDANDLKIVDGILKIAEALGKEVIAEGVETLDHGKELLRLGGELAQGYAIARPMPAAEVLDWIENYELPPQWNKTKKPRLARSAPRARKKA